MLLIIISLQAFKTVIANCLRSQSSQEKRVNNLLKWVWGAPVIVHCRVIKGGKRGRNSKSVPRTLTIIPQKTRLIVLRI